MISHLFKLIWNKRGSNALMILEILLSFIVLFIILAFLFFNFDRSSVPLGFEHEDRWRLFLDEVSQQDSAVAAESLTNLRNQLLEHEAIESVTFTEFMTPFINSVWQTSSDDHGFEILTQVVQVDLDFMETMGVKLNTGRWFTEDDHISEESRVMVNQLFIDRYFADKSMIDSTLVINGEHRLIGILDDYRYMGDFEEPWPIMFMLDHYYENPFFALLHMKPGTSASVEQELIAIANSATNQNTCTVDYLTKERELVNRDKWVLIYALASVCIFLCINVALGLFGVLWYNINRRKGEVGLRQAMGAHGSDIAKQFILEMVVLTAIALAIGLFFALQIPLLDVTEFSDSIFYRSAIWSTVIILVLVLLCALIPSLQASRIRPATALRAD